MRRQSSSTRSCTGYNRHLAARSPQKFQRKAFLALRGAVTDENRRWEFLFRNSTSSATVVETCDCLLEWDYCSPGERRGSVIHDAAFVSFGVKDVSPTKAGDTRP